MEAVKSCWQILVLLSVWAWFAVQASHANYTRQQLLRKLLVDRADYDPVISPDFEEDYPTKVFVQIYVLSLDSVNEASMDFSVDVFLRQKWTDTRLIYEAPKNIRWLELDHKMIQNVWVPDTFFPNEKRGDFHDITVPNRLMHLYPNGTVFYSIRLSMTLSCEMELHSYPLDIQICLISLESYSYTTENVIFQWYEGSPIRIPNSTLPQFYITQEAMPLSECQMNYGQGNFSCLEVNIKLTRNMGYYLAQIFIPSILIVMLSWVSFWVDAEATPARISLGVLTVLTITTQSSGARSTLPYVSYIKAIDVWMATCLTFVFASLLEFAYINVLTRRTRSIFMPLLTIGPDGLLTEGNKKKMSTAGGSYQNIDFTKRARVVDKVSRFVFPLLFLIFNLVFWVYYNS